MIRIVAPIAFCILTACGDWPEVPGSVAQGRSGSWPALVPLTDVIGLPTEGATGQDEAGRLDARADALRARAAVLRAPVPDSDAFEALRARMAG